MKSKKEKLKQIWKDTKKKVFIILLSVLIGIVIIQIVFACESGNSFTQGDNINICTGICKYQTPDLTTYFDCDSNVSCYLTSYYPNNTLISAHQLMSFNGSTFNYSLGSINVTGTYNHKILCYNQYGEFTKDFTSTISTSLGTVVPSQTGYGAYSNAITYTDYVACSYVYDFIDNNYNSGKINYTTDQLNELINQINNQGSDLSSETVINYISNYNSECNDFKVLPTNILVGMLEQKIETVKLPEKIFLEKYKYEVIFLLIISLGIFGFEYLKKERIKKKEIWGLK